MEDIKKATSKLVTPETYIRAETDRNFRNILEISGAINQLGYIRQPTALTQQPGPDEPRYAVFGCDR